MKKIILSLSFLLAFSVLGFAQTSDYSFSYGVKGGLNYSDLYGMRDSDGKYDISIYHGFQMGVFAEMTKANLKDFFLRGSLIYTKRGLEYSGEKTINQYVNIPVQIGYKYKVLSFASVYGLIGPSVQFRTYGNGYLKGIGSESEDSPYAYARNIVAGGEVNIGIEFLKHIQIEGGYQCGLTPDYNSSSRSGKNSTYTVTLGFLFGKK